MGEPHYIVICLIGEKKSESGQPYYVLASRKAFLEQSKAKAYADTIHPGRMPIVVLCPNGVEFREAK